MRPALSSAFERTLDIDIGISRTHRALNALVWFVGALVLAVLALSRPVLVLFVFAALGLALMSDRRISQKSPAAICRLQWRTDHSWRWMSVDGRWHEGRCVAVQRFGATLLCLLLDDGQRRFRRYPVALFADALDKHSHRRLRARLTVFPPSRAEMPEA